MLTRPQKFHYDAILRELHRLNIRFHPPLSEKYENKWLYEATAHESLIKHKVYWYIKWEKLRHVQ